MRLGFNLSSVTYWNDPCPFIDHMKAAGPWRGDNPPVRYCMVKMEPPGAAFVLTYEGAATIQLKQSVVTSSEAGRIEFTWDSADVANGQLQLIVKAGDPQNIRIVRKDHVALYAAGEIFNPDFLSLLKGLTHFRAMDWLKTNDSERTDILIDWPGSYADAQPVPLSVVVALANKTGLRPWINLPHLITDEAITAAFAYLDANLAPGLVAAVEYSNEVWNPGFDKVFAYAKAQGAAFDHGSANPAYWYGRTVARIAKLARGHRVGVHAMWQASGSPVWEKHIYPGFADAGGLDRDVEAFGCANYIHGTLNNYKLTDGPALMAANDIPGALANVAADLPALAAMYGDMVAWGAGHGWPFRTYEGGQYHLNTRLFGGTLKEDLREFYQRVQDDPRSAENIRRNAENFFAAGGDAMTIFNLTGRSTVDGYFGAVGAPAWAVYQARIADDAVDPVDAALTLLRAKFSDLAADLDALISSRAKG